MSCTTNNSSLLPSGSDGATGATGASGTNGTNGLDGTSILYNTTTPVSTSGPFTSLASHTLGASSGSTTNELSTIGDSIELISTLTISKATASTIAYANIRTYIGGGTTIQSPPTDILVPNGSETCLLKCIVTRKSATSVFIQYDAKFSGGANFNHTGGQYFHTPSFTVNNLDISTNIIEIRGGVVNGTLTLQNLLILKYKI